MTRRVTITLLLALFVLGLAERANHCVTGRLSLHFPVASRHARDHLASLADDAALPHITSLAQLRQLRWAAQERAAQRGQCTYRFFATLPGGPPIGR